MAEPHLDHPGETTWFPRYGPAPVIGPCPHAECKHLSVKDIAWGPDWDHYSLVACIDGCASQCRGWWREPQPGSNGPWRRLPEVWQQVDVERQAVGATWL